MKRKAQTGAEEDAFSRFSRRIYCYLQRAGVAKGLKRQANKRERHEAKRDIHKEHE